MGEVRLPPTYQSGNSMRRDHRGYRSQGRHSRGGGRGNRSAYQSPYFYSYSTTFVPGILNYPFNVGSYGGYNLGGYPYGYYPYGVYPYYGPGAFAEQDDYDSFFNNQPSASQGDAPGYGTPGYGAPGYGAPQYDVGESAYPGGQYAEYPNAAVPSTYREPYYGPSSGPAPRQQPAPPPVTSPAEPQAGTQTVAAADIEPQPATILVFKGGQPSRKIYNYVITSTAIYSFHGTRREEIPISAINVPATEAANRAEGVDFALPSAVQ